jgi:tripartite-type tricarboxylate transporter receptor subunit TctC
MKAIGIVATLSALLTAGNAFAQASYPDKPLRILVGFVAGGPADTVARVVGRGAHRHHAELVEALAHIGQAPSWWIEAQGWVNAARAPAIPAVFADRA